MNIPACRAFTPSERGSLRGHDSKLNPPVVRAFEMVPPVELSARDGEYGSTTGSTGRDDNIITRPQTAETPAQQGIQEAPPARLEPTTYGLEAQRFHIQRCARVTVSPVTVRSLASKLLVMTHGSPQIIRLVFARWQHTGSTLGGLA